MLPNNVSHERPQHNYHRFFVFHYDKTLIIQYIAERISR